MYDPLFNSGMLFSFLLGNYFDYIDQAKIQLILPVIFVLVLFCIPESPEYYIKRDNKLVNINLANQRSFAPE